MKESASSNYPVEKTIILTAKNSPVSSSYSKSKTTFIGEIKSLAANYPVHKTADIAVNAFVSSTSATVLKRTENYSESKTIQVLFKAGQSVSASAPVADLRKTDVPNYLSQKTVLITDKTTGIPIQFPLLDNNIPSTKNVSQVKESNKAISEPSKRQPINIVLTILSVIFILSTGVLSWMYWQEHKQLGLLLEDQKKLNEIAGLKVDDIIGGGLKNNNQFALTGNVVADIKFIRICFSVNGNQYTTPGNKTIFTRLLDPENNVVLIKDKLITNVNGKMIECTFKDEIVFGGEELFICRDIEKPESLAPGNYKIEIYSDELLKGQSSFELK